MQSLIHFCYSVAESCPILQPHGLPHARLLLFTVSWSLLTFMSIESLMLSNHLILCHPFSFSLQSFPASGSFPVSRLFPSGSQSFGTLVLASVLPKNIQIWFPVGLTDDLISLHSKGLSRVLSSTTVWKHQFFGAQTFLWSNSHIQIWQLEKTIALTRQTFASKVMSLLFNMLSRFVIAFLPRSKSLLISWLQSPSAVILELKKIKSVTVSIVSPYIYHEVMGPDAMIFVFWMFSFKPAFHAPLSPSSRSSLVPPHFLS